MPRVVDREDSYYDPGENEKERPPRCRRRVGLKNGQTLSHFEPLKWNFAPEVHGIMDRHTKKGCRSTHYTFRQRTDLMDPFCEFFCARTEVDNADTHLAAP